MSSNFTASVRINISEIVKTDIPAHIQRIQQYNAVGGSMQVVIATTAAEMANAIQIQKEYTEAAIASTVVIEDQVSSLQQQSAAIAASTQALAAQVQAQNAVNDIIKQTISITTDATTNLTNFTDEIKKMSGMSIEPTVNVSYSGNDLNEFAKQLLEIQSAGAKVSGTLKTSGENVKGYGALITRLAKRHIDLKIAINAVSEAASQNVTVAPLSIGTTTDIGPIVDQFNMLSQTGVEANAVIKMNADTFQELSIKAKELADAGIKVSVALDATRMSATDTNTALQQLNADGVKNVTVGLQEMTQANTGGSYSSRRLLFDLRMLSFAARTLQRQYAEDDEQLKQLTDTMVTFSAMGSGVVVTMSMLSAASKGLASVWATAAGSGLFMTVTLGTMAIPLIAIAAAIAGVIAAWTLFNAGLKERSGWQAAQNSIKQYKTEMKNLEVQMKQIRYEQAKLNEETTRYNLLTSQIEYAVALQGYETEKQTSDLAYINLAQMSAGLTGGALASQQATAQRREMEGEMFIESGEGQLAQERTAYLREIAADIRSLLVAIGSNPYTGMDGYETGGVVQKTGPALVHAGELVVPRDQAGSMGGGGFNVIVNFPNANFNTANEARSTSESAAQVLGLEVRRRIEASRYGVKRP